MARLVGEMSFTSKAKDRVVDFAGNYPKITRGLLGLLSPILPNRWIFNRIVHQSGGKFIARAKLGNGMKIRVVLGDMVGCHIYYDGYYEPCLVKLVESHVGPGTVFFDVGAHVGQYTLLAAALGAEVHSFEPTPSTFELLKQNVASNHLSDVHLNDCALSDQEGTADFYLAGSANIGQNSLFDSDNHRERCTVRCTTLDHYLRSGGVNLAGRRIFVKMDVERAELNVLRGACLLLAARPVILFEVLPGTSGTAEIYALLNRLDYRLFVADENGVVPLNEAHAGALNILALPS